MISLDGLLLEATEDTGIIFAGFARRKSPRIAPEHGSTYRGINIK